MSSRAYLRNHTPNSISPDRKKKDTVGVELPRPKSDGQYLPRLCTLDGFTEVLAKLGGLDPSLLDPLSQITVTTETTTYRITLIDPTESRVLVQDPKFFPVPLEAQLCGASFGGSFLKQQWIGIGMKMELYCEWGHIVTAAVVSVEVEKESEIPGPF